MQRKLCCLGNAQRFRNSPVTRRVDNDPLCAILKQNIDHARIAHFGRRVDGERGIKSAVEYLAYGLFIVVIDDHHTWIKPVLDANIHATGSASFFVTMRCVDHHWELQLFGQVQLSTKVTILQICLFVVADFTDCNYAFLERKAG